MPEDDCGYCKNVCCECGENPGEWICLGLSRSVAGAVVGTPTGAIVGAIGGAATSGASAAYTAGQGAWGGAAIGAMVGFCMPVIVGLIGCVVAPLIVMCVCCKDAKGKRTAARAQRSSSPKNQDPYQIQVSSSRVDSSELKAEVALSPVVAKAAANSEGPKNAVDEEVHSSSAPKTGEGEARVQAPN